MAVLRILSLLLALGLSAPASAYVIDSDGDILAAYSSPGGSQFTNNSTDYSEFQCVILTGTGDPNFDFGCVDNAGNLCSANTTGICDVQRVPPGRCSAGDSITCVFPTGAGFCVPDAGTSYSDEFVGCMPDDTNEWGATTGTFVSSMCAAGSNSLCDMSNNDPACACQGHTPASDPNDPFFATWEGNVCGSNAEVRCSDGDPLRDVGGYGPALCTSISLPVPNTPASLRCGNTNAGLGLDSSPPYGVENVTLRYTPQRQPGAGFAAPNTKQRVIQTTATWKLDSYDDPNNAHQAFNIRQIKLLGNSYYQDAGWGAGAANESNLNNTIITHFCDPPAGWSVNHPLSGNCFDDPNTGTDESTIACTVSDAPCATGNDPNNACNPATLQYCWELARDADGLIYTRDVSPTEISDANKTGICPPDCRLDNDFHTFNAEAILAAGNPSLGKDPRAGVQLALDNAVGPRMGKGDITYVVAITSMTWLDPDNRCYIGGDPDVVDQTCVSGFCGSSSYACAVNSDCAAAIGRCENSAKACNPAATPGTDCSGGDGRCLLCAGTWNGTSQEAGVFTDPVNGTSDATPVGYYDPTGDLPLHTAGDTDRTRVGPTTDKPTAVRVPLYSIFTSGKSSAESRDNTCNPAGGDYCLLGEVTAATGAVGIGSGGSFTTNEAPAYDPLGGNFTAGATWAANNPGTKAGAGFLRLYDRTAGPDGVHGCLGDNVPQVGVACDRILGSPGVTGSTGSDDVPLLGDFSLAQAGPADTPAAFARFKMVDPTRRTPIWNAVSSITGRDEDLLAAAGTKNLDFINKTNSTWCPIDPNTGDFDCDRTAESFCSEYGGDTNDNQICDDLEGCPDADGDTICDGVDNCPNVFNPSQTASIQDGLVGVGCSCLCGDVNNSCTVSGVDVQDIQNQILPQIGSQVGCYQIGSPDDQGICNTSGLGREVRGCDVNASGTCSGVDAQVTQLDLPNIFGTPTYPLANGYSPTNCAQSTPDTCGPDAAACP